MPRFVTPNSRFKHLFVVVRLPDAQAEADRLNALNGDHWSYWVDVVRLVE
jgi:hypothetical protein